MSIVGNSIVLDVRNPDTFQPIAAHYLSLTPFRRLIRDYFRIRDAYYEAIRSAQPFQIETVDMARRGLHNDAAELLRTRLDNKLIIDLNTARRLFTLICAVQPYASRIDESTSKLPTVLFVCSMNAVRSPIAAALARQAFPGRLIARSVGVTGGKVDQFVHQVMEEVGIDMSVHTPHILDELVANHFDLVICLSDDAAGSRPAPSNSGRSPIPLWSRAIARWFWQLIAPCGTRFPSAFATAWSLWFPVVHKANELK